MNWKNEIIGLQLKVLILEDSMPDFELIQEQLIDAGYILDTTHAVNQNDFVSSLNHNHLYDIILSDFNLPEFDAFGALQISKKLCPEIPFICVSGSIGEETAIELLKLGAVDYVLKDRPGRLPFAVKRALDEQKERKALQLAEEELKRNEAKFRTLTENIPDIVARYDNELRLIYINPAINKITRRHIESFIGKTNKELGMPKEKLALWNESMRYVFQTGKQLIFEFDLRTKEDTSYFSTMLVPEFSENGDINTLLSVTRNISERKRIEIELRKSEERFRDIIFSSADWVWEVDKNLKYTYSSQKVHDLLEASEEEIIGKTPFDFMPEKEANRVATIFSEIVAKRKPIKDLENWNLGKKGELICLLTNGVPVFNDAGELNGYRGINKNITERKLSEYELIKAKEKAEESDRLKLAFLANMSHEIRTPMNGILGFTDLLLNPDLNSEEKENYIKIVHKSGQRMLNTVNDIIEISKIEAGLVGLKMGVTDINNRIEELIQFFTPGAENKGLTLIIDKLLPAEKKSLYTDQNKLDSILTNLIRNAIKYTPKGTINIGCQFNGPLIEFYIKDSGIGIPKHRQEAIFNRFEQADISDTRAFEGSGLGLAICKSYVEMLGGKIWVESEAGIGSTFYYTIPVISKMEEKPTPPDEPLLQSKNANFKIDKLNVLIAEDDEISRMFLSLLINDFCNVILEAETGTKAVELCRIHKDLDLIFMDIKMPGLNGYEATRQIREFNRETVIIAQTAYALSGDKEKAIEAGCNDYISKPIDKNKLQPLIQKYFGIGL